MAYNALLLAVIGLLGASAFILYVLFGYPLLLAWRARLKGRPVRCEAAFPTVTLILAVYNGERWIRAKLQSILQLEYARELLRVIVVSDGSDDGTEAIVREFPEVQLLRVPRGGKALALNAGIARAQGEILFFTDVRQKLAPDSLARLVSCFADPSVGVVSGELIIREGDSSAEASVGLYWRYEKWIRKCLSQLDSILGATGCIYAMRRELARPMPPDTLLDDMYLPLGAFFQGYRVVMQESAKAFDVPTALDTEFRRKVRTLAGVYQVMRFFPRLLWFSNRMLLHFVSHKLARLLLPFAFLVVAASSLALPAPWRLVALAGQGVFYGLAVIDPWIPERFPLKRLSSVVRTFVVLLAAALWAVSIFFLPSGKFWTTSRKP